MDADNNDSLWRSTGQAVFELVQQSLQCGPLAGSQPGYFKRCGSETAAVVLAYLETIVTSDEDVVETLGFTEKQAAALGNVEAQRAESGGQSETSLQVRVEKARKGGPEETKVVRMPFYFALFWN